LSSQDGLGQLDATGHESTAPQSTEHAQEFEQLTCFKQLDWPQVTSQLPVPQVIVSLQLSTLEQSTLQATVALHRIGLVQEFCAQTMSQAAPWQVMLPLQEFTTEQSILQSSELQVIAFLHES
jgi:hypothetical protein